MKANVPKRKVFQDAVDLISPETVNVVDNGKEMISVEKIVPFHNHPFRLYEGKRLDDMVESIKEHGVLIPVIVKKIADGYEMLSGHNRWNAAKIVGIKEIPAIIKENLIEREAYVYVIETNMLQRSFDDLLPSEKAAVLVERYEKVMCQGRRNDILEEIAIHKMEDAIVKMVELEDEIYSDIHRLVEIKTDITRLIKRLSNRDQQLILEQRYLCFRPWEQIAVDLDYSIQHTFRIHDIAVKEIAKFLEDES